MVLGEHSIVLLNVSNRGGLGLCSPGAPLLPPLGGQVGELGLDPALGHL